MAQRRAVDFAARQKSRMRVNGRLRIEETVLGDEISQVEICLVKRAHRADVFPVTLKNERAHMSIFYRLRNDVLAKVNQLIVETFHEHVAVENIDTH